MAEMPAPQYQGAKGWLKTAGRAGSLFWLLRFTLFPHESAAVMLMPQNHEASEHPSLNENWPRQRGIELGIVCSCLLVWKPNSCRVFFCLCILEERNWKHIDRYFIVGYWFGGFGNQRSEIVVSLKHIRWLHNASKKHFFDRMTWPLFCVCCA